MLEPVVCNTLADITKLGNEMKVYASIEGDAAHDEMPEYSRTEEEAMERAKDPQLVEYVRNQPTIRVILLRGQLPVTVALSLDRWRQPISWDLSMSIPTNPPGRVPDELAPMVAEAMLGKDCQEIPPEGAIKAVRQFLRAVGP